MDVEERARRRRREASERYRPARIGTLLVAEAPPTALDRFFYFEDVQTQDSLFRHVAEAVLSEKPSRDKAPYLDELKERGWFLIHVAEDPIGSRREQIPPLVPDLIQRCRELAPDRIVIIGAPIYDLVFTAMRDALLPVVDARIAYPGSGQQNRFKDLFSEIV
ncbi:MAG: hypothetical protein ACJ735_15880 [Actinomycetes bacterium]